MLRSKYGNKKKYYGGEMFDSKRELKRYQELQMLERIGRISDLKRQVRFELIPEQREQSDEIYTRGPNKGKPKPGRIIEKAVNYVADFVYTEKGVTIVEDAKGVRTKEYVIKKKLMLYVHNIRINEV